MKPVSIQQLTKTEDESIERAQSQSMKRMRLKSLQLDPKSFISTYEGECDQATEFWLNRLREPFVEHWYAVIDDELPSPSIDGPDLLSKEWVAFLVVLDKDAMAKSSVEGAESEKYQGTSIPSYSMEALWVDPIVRGQGVGKAMIARVVEWVETQIESQQRQVASVNTTARKGNTQAIKLYQSLGFQILDDNAVYEVNGISHQTVVMKLEVHA